MISELQSKIDPDSSDLSMFQDNDDPLDISFLRSDSCEEFKIEMNG